MLLHYLIVLLLLCLGISNAETCDETFEVADNTITITRPNITDKTKTGTARIVGQEPTGTTHPCIISLKTSEEYRLKVDLSVPEQKSRDANMDTCTDNYVSVGDDKKTQNGKICKAGAKFQFDSNGNQAVIKYESKTVTKSNMQWTYTAMVRRVDPKKPCGSLLTQLKNEKIVYEFPASGTKVEIATKCQFTITSDTDKKIKAQVEKLNLFDTEGCVNDYLKLSTGTVGQEYKVCRSQTKWPEFVTDGNQLMMELMVTHYNMSPSARITFESYAMQGSMQIRTFSVGLTLLLPIVFTVL